MKRFMLTTALVAFAATPVVAQTSNEAPAVETESHELSAQVGAGTYLEMTGDTTIYGSEFIGKNVYVTEGASHTATVEGVPSDWENVATVDDVLMTRDGEIRGILVDVGGFLGIGARTVALDMDALDIVYDSDSDDFYVVFASSREELEAAPEYDRAADLEARPGTWNMASDTDAQPESDVLAQDQAPMTDPVTDPVAEPQAADAADDLAAPVNDRIAAERGEISVDDLKSADVFDATDERIAGVSDVLVTQDGDVSAIVVDVGGFLGIGAKSVAIDYAEVDVFHGEDASDLRVHLPMTRDQLEDMPEYEG